MAPDEFGPLDDVVDRAFHYATGKDAPAADAAFDVGVGPARRDAILQILTFVHENADLPGMEMPDNEKKNHDRFWDVRTYGQFREKMKYAFCNKRKGATTSGALAAEPVLA